MFGVHIGGCQAEYVRVPQADVFVFAQPDDIPEATLLLMADILPTGYFVAAGAKRLMMEGEGQHVSGKLEDLEKTKQGVCVVIGCGPVGLCAISSAVNMFETVFATDLAEHRLEAARKHGAIALPKGELDEAIKAATEGRGADAACEVVGHSDAIERAIELVRPFGVISSCGVHSKDITTSARGLYAKKWVFSVALNLACGSSSASAQCRRTFCLRSKCCARTRTCSRGSSRKSSRLTRRRRWVSWGSR